MSEFFVGQEVVCVDDDLHNEWPANRGVMGIIEVKRGTHYVVRGIIESRKLHSGLGLQLRGIERQRDYPFSSIRFRPVKSDSIAIFRQMCISPRPLVPVE